MTQTGNIKVVRDLNGSGYIAYLPDGSKCEYTLSGGYGSLWYPHRNIALDGHVLSYSYYNEGNIKLVSRIDYGEDRSLCFSYEEADNEQSQYVDGISLGYGKKLSKIEVKRGDYILRQYVMTYRDNDIKSPLVQVDMLDSVDNTVNPLHFYYYGNQISNGTDSLTDRQLSAFFNSIQDPESYISFRGKLDYMTEDDAVIIYPNKSNYYYNVGSEIVVNDYGTNDHIIINYGLNVSTSSHCTLDAGTGFVDAFCMDVDGRYGEELVKVNQSVTNDSECMQFSVYRLMINGLIPIDTVNIYQNALMHKGKKTLWPTQFLTGDFTGDGKEEVLICRTDGPLGESEPAMVSMIRLDSGTVIYTGTLEKFHLYIPVYPADDEMNIARTRGSDRLFASDLDGDGKLELCVLNTSGLDIYRFGYNASGQVVKSKSRNNNLLLSQAYDYIVTVGDVNGDGNTDLVYLPDVANKGIKAYLSMGDDTFQYKLISVYSNTQTKLMCFDYNQDGQTDIVRYTKPNYFNYKPYTDIYALRNGVIDTTYRISRTEPSILVPISFFGQNSNMAMLSIKSHGKYDIHRCSKPANMDALMVGIVDSRGRIAQMQYRQLYQSEWYEPGFDAVFPYTTFAGNMFVCSQMSKTAGNIVESSLSYVYDNATIHLQGLGFCGFRSIQTIDNVRGESILQMLNPENFGVPVSVTSPRGSCSYTHNSIVGSDKRIKVLLTSETSVDNVTGVSSASTYSYDAYGNLTSGQTTSGGITKNVTNVYENVDNDTTWIIGLERRHAEELSRNGQSVIDGRTTTYNSSWLPDTIITWKGTQQNAVQTKVFKYDDLKRPVRIKTRAYAGSTLKRYYDYTGNSRCPEGIRDESGIYTSMEYGPFGLTASSVVPEFGQRVDNDEPLPDIPPHVINPSGGSNEVNGGRPPVVVDPIVNPEHPVTTSYHYDSFGRIDTTTVSGGTVKTVSRSWSDIDVPNALYIVESHESGSPIERVWYDALGRKIQTATQRFDGLWSKAVVQYDARSRVSAVSQPSIGNAYTQWTTFEYDSYDRLTEKQYPDNHVDTYVYNGLSTTATIDGETSTRTVDEKGNLVAVTDGGGSIAYTLRPDGQPAEIRVGGVIATTFEYDQFGRRTAINDPSAGRRTTVYDIDGYVRRETDARGDSVVSNYDAIGKLLSRTFSDGQTVNFTYDSWNAPKTMTDNRGHSKSWTYNNQRRVATETVDGFKKTYTYNNNQLSSIAYHKGNAYICSENYQRQNGHVTSVTLNTGDTIWSLRGQDARLLPVSLRTGKLDQSFSYDLRGNVTSRTTARANGDTIRWMSYSYSPGTGNMLYRKDKLNGLEEEFSYDNLNRLTDITMTDSFNNQTALEMDYDGKGNILSRDDAGTFGYDATLPYGMSGLTSPAASIPMRDQHLHYNAMQQPDTIIENGYTALLSYYGDKSRAAMTVTGPDGYRFSCSYYDQQYNEFSKTMGNVTQEKSVLWLGGSPYNAPAALLKDYGESTWQVVYVLRDNMGSITHVVDTTGVVLQETGFTAWGQLRDPQTGAVYGTDVQPELLLGRGYTGHEHLPWFGLINMNARLYDPSVGRFLSPDPIVQAPDNTQNFNRYSYCMNNPLKFTDPDGKIFWLFPILVGAAIGAVTSGVTYAISAAISGNWNSRAFWKSIGIGALSGAISSVLSFGWSAIGKGITSAIGRYGLRFSYSVVSQASSNIVSNILFDRDFHLRDILAIVGASALGAAIPGYKARSKYSDFKNSACEMLYHTGVGGATGLVQGGVRTAFDGDTRHLYQDMLGGMCSGFGSSLTINMLLGSPYAPEHSPGDLGTFRRGGLIMPLLEAFKMDGITLGQNLCITDEGILRHEYYHLMQQHSVAGGWSGFYARILYEYLLYGYDGASRRPGTLENDAYKNSNNY